MHCPYCNTEIPENMKSVKVCPGCGTYFAKNTKSPEETVTEAMNNLTPSEREDVETCREEILKVSRKYQHLALLAMITAAKVFEKELDHD